MLIEIINNNNILKTWYQNFARSAGVHYYHCVSPSVRSISFWHRILIKLRSPRGVHITVS